MLVQTGTNFCFLNDFYLQLLKQYICDLVH